MGKSAMICETKAEVGTETFKYDVYGVYNVTNPTAVVKQKTYDIGIEGYADKIVVKILEHSKLGVHYEVKRQEFAGFNSDDVKKFYDGFIESKRNEYSEITKTSKAEYEKATMEKNAVKVYEQNLVALIAQIQKGKLN